MSKSTFFTGQPVLNQLLSLIPRNMVLQLSRVYKSDRYCKKFKLYDHLVTMLFSAFNQCTSLRELTTGMQASSVRLAHLGLQSTPRRSTLAEANRRRDPQVFADLYKSLHHLYYGRLPDSLHKKKLLDKLFIVDSSLVSLFSNVLQSTGNYGLNGKKKGGIKAHTLLRAKDDLPCFIRLSEGKQSDTSIMSQIALPKGSIIVMDKAYRNYQQYATWSAQEVSWVTRLHGRAVYRIVSEREVSEAQKAQGVQHDYQIHLGNPKTTYLHALQDARLVEFYDKETQRMFSFITNNFRYSAATIANIYKQRWQIELFFKRIKQHFQLHYFLGDNENAIHIQLWCALIADLLLKVIKDKVNRKRKWSMSNLSGLVRLHLGTYINLMAFLANPEKALIGYEDPIDNKQLNLFSKTTRGA